MKVFHLLSLYLSLSLLFCSCFKKQHHDITAPKTPIYTVSGSILDMDSKKPLSNIKIILVAVEMLYNYDFTEEEQMGNGEGKYKFENITPGMYNLIVYRDTFPVIQQSIAVNHEDKDYNIFVPKYIYSSFFYPYPNYPFFNGICWKTPAIMAGTGAVGSNGRFGVTEGTYKDGFTPIGLTKYTVENPYLYGLAYLEGYWTTDGEAGGTTIFSMNSSKGNVGGETRTKYTITDLTSSKDNIWASVTPGKVIQFGKHPSLLEKVIDVEAHQPNAIAWDGTSLWIYDLNENLLVQLDDNFKSKNSYRPFAWKVDRFEIFSEIEYMTFDFAGDLWLVEGWAGFKIKMGS